MARRKPLERLQTANGDWYVATTPEQWPAAMARQSADVHARETRMRDWRLDNPVVGYPPASYWVAYNAEMYRISIEWPIPAGHVMFEQA